MFHSTKHLTLDLAQDLKAVIQPSIRPASCRRALARRRRRASPPRRRGTRGRRQRPRSQKPPSRDAPAPRRSPARARRDPGRLPPGRNSYGNESGRKPDAAEPLHTRHFDAFVIVDASARTRQRSAAPGPDSRDSAGRTRWRPTPPRRTRQRSGRARSRNSHPWWCLGSRRTGFVRMPFDAGAASAAGLVAASMRSSSERRTIHLRTPARDAFSCPLVTHCLTVAGLTRSSSAISASVSHGSAASRSSSVKDLLFRSMLPSAPQLEYLRQRCREYSVQQCPACCA